MTTLVLVDDATSPDILACLNNVYGSSSDFGEGAYLLRIPRKY